MTRQVGADQIAAPVQRVRVTLRAVAIELLLPLHHSNSLLNDLPIFIVDEFEALR